VPDLNRDGRNDLLLCYTLVNPPGANSTVRHVFQAHVLALSGRNGRVLWHDVRECSRPGLAGFPRNPAGPLAVQVLDSDGEVRLKITWEAWSWIEEPGHAMGPHWRILRGRDGRVLANGDNSTAAAAAQSTGPGVRPPDREPGTQFRPVDLDGDGRAEWLEESLTGKLVAWRGDFSGPIWSADAPAHVRFTPVEIVAAEQGRAATLVRRSTVASGPTDEAGRIDVSIWMLDGRTGRTVLSGHSRLAGRSGYWEWLSPVTRGRYVLRDWPSRLTECRSVSEAD
jgi:hypothetical protein